MNTAADRKDDPIRLDELAEIRCELSWTYAANAGLSAMVWEHQERSTNVGRSDMYELVEPDLVNVARKKREAFTIYRYSNHRAN